MISEIVFRLVQTCSFKIRVAACPAWRYYDGHDHNGMLGHYQNDNTAMYALAVNNGRDNGDMDKLLMSRFQSWTMCQNVKCGADGCIMDAFFLRVCVLSCDGFRAAMRC